MDNKKYLIQNLKRLHWKISLMWKSFAYLHRLVKKSKNLNSLAQSPNMTS